MEDILKSDLIQNFSTSDSHKLSVLSNELIQNFSTSDGHKLSVLSNEFQTNQTISVPCDCQMCSVDLVEYAVSAVDQPLSVTSNSAAGTGSMVGCRHT
jgi:S-adenosylhomocysteine hydrolase